MPEADFTSNYFAPEHTRFVSSEENQKNTSVHHSQLTYHDAGSFQSPHINRNQWMNDMKAIYNLARMWYLTGNPAYAQKSHDILLAWANTQTSLAGTESNLDYAFHFAFLLAG